MSPEKLLDNSLDSSDLSNVTNVKIDLYDQKKSKNQKSKNVDTPFYRIYYLD